MKLRDLFENTQRPMSFEDFQASKIQVKMKDVPSYAEGFADADLDAEVLVYAPSKIKGGYEGLVIEIHDGGYYLMMANMEFEETSDNLEALEKRLYHDWYIDEWFPEFQDEFEE